MQVTTMMASRGLIVRQTLRPCSVVGHALGRVQTSRHALFRVWQCPHVRPQRTSAASVEAVTEETAAEQPVAEQPVAEQPAASAETSGASPLDAEAPAAADTQGLSTYALNFLWLEKNIAVAVDQVISETQRSPLTEYFFWPRKDAWEELKSCLESKPWISERDKVLLLNRTTEVINFWQDEEQKHSISEAQEKFPDCKFLGA